MNRKWLGLTIVFDLVGVRYQFMPFQGNELYLQTDFWSVRASKDLMSRRNHRDGSGPERPRNHKKQKKLQRNFLDTIELSKKLAVTKRAEIKQKTDILLKLYDLCKEHGGPITIDEDSLKLLTTVNRKQLLSEISYLRLTIAPKIRQ